MDRYCVVTLIKPETKERRRIVWKLNKNSVVDRWVHLINSCNKHGPYVKYTSWGMFADKSKLTQVVEKINTLIQNFNKLTTDARFDPLYVDDITQELLNELRHQYLDYVKSFKDTTPVLDLLHAISQQIYAISKILEINDSYVSSSFSAYLMNEASIPIQMPLLKSDYSMFTLGYNFGDLMLGYGDGTKSLFHIYKDGDMTLLRGEGPTPQTSISTNFLAMFYEGTEDKFEREPFYAWCQKHDIEDYENPVHGTGNIILGSLYRTTDIAKMNKREIISHFSDYSTIESVVITTSPPK